MGEAAFGETMRHSFPILSPVRTAAVDVEVGGTLVPAGDLVQISIGSANNDERVVADPRRFDLRRGDLWRAKELRKGYDPEGVHGHVGFGLGKHFCLGYEMARVESVIGSQVLLDACPDLRLAVAPEDVEWKVIGATWSAQRVPVVW